MTDLFACQGCCTSRPTDTGGPDHGRSTAPPPIRHSPHAITSQTAINGGSQDTDSRNLAPPSGLSIHQSETSSRRSRRQDTQSTITAPALIVSYPLPIITISLSSHQAMEEQRQDVDTFQLHRERYEFFETRVAGRKEIWSG